jgi:hypothetical protein
MADSPALWGAIAERLHEVLPSDEFRITAKVDGVSIVWDAANHHRHATLDLSGLMLELPLPGDVRLRLFFENQAASVQEFVSDVTGTAWPAPGARPHVHVEPTSIEVWYDGPDPASASLTWRPLDRTALGL